MTTPHEAAAKAVSGELPHLEPGVTNLDRRVATAAIEALRDGAVMRVLDASDTYHSGLVHETIGPGEAAAIVDAILGPQRKAEPHTVRHGGPDGKSERITRPDEPDAGAHFGTTSMEGQSWE